jgi:hypothetical protein
MMRAFLSPVSLCTRRRRDPLLWGDADETVGRVAADQVPDRVNELLMEHLARHPT